MKFLATCLGFFLISQSLALGKGIEFFHGTLAEAKELASQEGKLIFIDAFTTWCGPCKRMSAQVFTQEEVGEFYNQTFVNLKLDMEKGEGKDFQPCFLWIQKAPLYIKWWVVWMQATLSSWVNLLPQNLR